MRTIADDHVIVNAEVHQLGGLDELPCQPRILA
jgi:hypothetical protein